MLEIFFSGGLGACTVSRILADKSHSCFRHKRKRLRLKHQPQVAPHKHGLGKHSSARIYSAQLEQSGKIEKQTWGQNPVTTIYTGIITNHQHKIIYTVSTIRTGNLFIYVAAANTEWLMEKSSFATNNFDFSEEWGEAKLSVNAC